MTQIAGERVGVLTLSTYLQFDRELLSLQAMLKRYAIVFDRIVLSGEVPPRPKFSRLALYEGDEPVVGARRMERAGEMLLTAIEAAVEPAFATSPGFGEIFKTTADDRDALQFDADNVSRPGLIHADTVEGLMARLERFDYMATDLEQKQSSLKLAMDLVDHDYRFFAHVQSVSPNYSPIVSPKMVAVLEDVLRVAPATGSGILESVADIEMFDFATLSWDQILELRRSRFAGAFRAKVFEWLRSYKDVTSKADLERTIQHEIAGAKFDFLRANRPQLKKTMLSALASNIPLPIPNPVSLAEAVKAIERDKRLVREFGWLFFVLEGFDAANLSPTT